MTPIGTPHDATRHLVGMNHVQARKCPKRSLAQGKTEPKVSKASCNNVLVCQVAGRDIENHARATLTSIQPSSFISIASSFVLDPFTATLLLGGAARSSAPPMAGLFLSSILGTTDGRGDVEGDVATGIRQRVKRNARRNSVQGCCQSESLAAISPVSQVSSCSCYRADCHQASCEKNCLGGREFGDGGRVIVARS